MYINQLAAFCVATLTLFTPLASARKVERSSECLEDGKTINMSFTYMENKIYFNNHCESVMTIYYSDEHGDWGKGFDVNDETKGNKKVSGRITDVEAYVA